MEHPDFTPLDRRIGIGAAGGGFALGLTYLATLIVGLAARATPAAPIPDPFFSLMELQIILIAPLLVALMAAVHAYAPRERRGASLLALVFMALLAGLTATVHFVILTVSRQIAALGPGPWVGLVFSFTWPSVLYSVDILAWDVFYSLAVLFAAPVFVGGRLARAVRGTLIASGVLSLAGLLGVARGDMQLRLLIGVTGYAGLFPVACLLLALLFRQTAPAAAETTPPRAAPELRASPVRSRP